MVLGSRDIMLVDVVMMLDGTQQIHSIASLLIVSGILPPAIRRMGEGNIFSLFTLVEGGGAGGTPSQVQVGGYPIPGPGRGGTPSQVQVGGGYPIPGPGGGGVPRQSSTASTCYAAGGVPLAFTQEDFLVHNIFRATLTGFFLGVRNVKKDELAT